MKYGSNLVEEAVEQFASLPGIGRKTALRLVLHMIRKDEGYAEKFGSSIVKMRKEIKRCNQCCNISDQITCEICLNKSRDHDVICVVENIRDVLAIEDTGQYNGLYHVLGGVISPIEGVTPDQLYIQELQQRIENNPNAEVILAISPTIDGDTTSFYLYKLLSTYGVKLSQLSRGIAYGGEIEYADEVTLGRSILSRMPYGEGVK